jgi:hypothetical protein
MRGDVSYVDAKKKFWNAILVYILLRKNFHHKNTPAPT